MKFYQILIQNQIPPVTLLYKTTEIMETGQLVEVEVRKNIVRGIVWSEELKKDFYFPVKKIRNTLPYIFSKKSLDFLKYIAVHTFNPMNTILEAMLRPFDKFVKKDWEHLRDIYEDSISKENTSTKNQNNLNLLNKNISQDYNQNTDNSKTYKKLPKIEILGSSELVVRIRHIMRSNCNHFSPSDKGNLPDTEEYNLNHSFPKNLLIVCPEIKILEKIRKFTESEINNIHESLNFSESQFDQKIQVYTYPDITSKEKKLVKILLQSKNQHSRLNIIITLRSGIFLPFQSVSEVFLIDESNNNYIQEQNKLYFDTRELIYYLGKIWGANMYFFDDFPSLRLYNSNKSQVSKILNVS